MNYAELDKLETNIQKAVETIQKLQSENQQLKQEKQGLLNRIREYEKKIEQFRNLSQDDMDLAGQLYSYRQKEVKIKQKIQQMLERLATSQQLSISD